MLAVVGGVLGCGQPPVGPVDGGGRECEPGTEGCACASQGRCATRSTGEQLVCTGGTCEAMSCPVGSTACVCRGGVTCDDPNDACTSGFCIKRDCAAGSLGCACVAGTCDVGLTCMSDAVCIDSTGHEGGACFADGRCSRGNRCDVSTGRCVYCELGSAMCQCTTNRGCNVGLVCAAEQCVPASQLPPANPVCYTPCRADQVTDAGVTVCPTDQVLDGCLPGQTCTQGSCLAQGESKPTCVGDVDCPFFQVCLRGGCYSNCTVNADCPSGSGCFKRACRPTCQVAKGAAPCASGYACTADDGQNGFCTPLPRPGAMPAPLPQGGLRLPVQHLALSNVKPIDRFIVVPRAAIVQDVTVRKLWHQVTRADGTTERVDAPLDTTGQLRPCNAAMNECPLPWLELTPPGGAAVRAEAVTYRLAPGCLDDVSAAIDAGVSQVACGKVTVGNAGGGSGVRWEGALEISTRDARATVTLSYVQRPEGQWAGEMHYFGTFNKTGLQAWIDAPTKSVGPGVENGLLQRWGALRAGALQGWDEFTAVLTSTRTESWKLGEVQAKCRALNGGSLDADCYPYTNTAGVRTYVSNRNVAPIPSGVSQLPFAVNLKVGASPTVFEGRIESSIAMHYPGRPTLKVELAADPALATSCFTGGGADCLVFLKNLDTSGASGTNQLAMTVGGRYLPGGSTCATGYGPADVPWLIPEVQANVTTRPNGERVRTECREQQLPFDTVAGGQAVADLNRNLSIGNPVPDGAPRRRSLRFLDGALVNQSQLFLIFEEKYESFIPGQVGASAYGYILLKRTQAELGPGDYSGTAVATGITRVPPTRPGASCSPAMIAAINNGADPQTRANVLLNGTSVSNVFTPLSGNATVHYLCQDLGTFDNTDRAIPSSTDGGTLRGRCPEGSKVSWFLINRTDAQMRDEPCNRQFTVSDGGVASPSSCQAVLNTWRANGLLIEENPTYRCTAPNTVYCDDDRLDLRNGKQFYQRTGGTSTTRAFNALQPLIDSAFRYKTRFRSSTGGQVGFAPKRCVPNSDQVPYCYDPAEIEEARDRIDCLLAIYGDAPTLASLSPALRDQLQQFLKQTFSRYPAPGGRTYEGFARLDAELSIMLGDDALTAAYASRFDLAAAGGATFKGSQFEKGGIDLTGVAGAEMYQLYQATQYYALALDRLYALGPDFAVALSRGPVGSDLDFVSPETVTEYLERLVRAAAQKARAWAEISRRYQSFNRPDLARLVIERAYVNAYLESALLSSLMFDIDDRSSATVRPQLRIVIEKMQRTFRIAMVDMREVYQQITERVDWFGLAPDYIPFPALDQQTAVNAYESISNVTRQRLDLARIREQTALQGGRQGKADAVQFQSELTNVRNTYENQLAQTCGTFQAQGRAWPAVSKYAALDPTAVLMGDPCGRMGNGELHNAMVNVSDSQLKLEGAVLRHSNLMKDIQIEDARSQAQCNIAVAQGDYQFTRAGQVATMQTELAKQRALIGFIMGSINAVMEGVKTADCELQCASSAVNGVAVAELGILSAEMQYLNELRTADAEHNIRTFEAQSFKKLAEFDCQRITIDSTARIAALYNDTLEAQLEVLRAEYALRLAISEVKRHASLAQRLQLQQAEAEQLAIDVQAAQNDPNVRIYQNDAVINADLSFRDALQMAYRQTRVFEYYTSQSYAKKEQLFLIRMVQAGQYNLDNYLLELDNAFQQFEEEFGNPDLRVLALSLRDDVMQIPYVGIDKQPLSEAQRIKMMTDRLKDVSLVDARGYLTLPFSTQLKALSPLTRNHKIHHVEADLQGGRMGDHVARVYLRMSGTGQVRNVNDDVDFYVFPERTAVVNASILGNKLFDPEVYRNFRFRDRPLVNTQWELVINQRDELANKDIDLQSLADVRVLIYYTDFTTF